jgi:hypothetical protein
MGGAGVGRASAGGREGVVGAHGNVWSSLCVHHIKYLTGMHALLAADMLLLTADGLYLLLDFACTTSSTSRYIYA